MLQESTRKYCGDLLSQKVSKLHRMKQSNWLIERECFVLEGSRRTSRILSGQHFLAFSVRKAAHFDVAVDFELRPVIALADNEAGEFKLRLARDDFFLLKLLRVKRL